MARVRFSFPTFRKGGEGWGTRIFSIPTIRKRSATITKVFMNYERFGNQLLYTHAGVKRSEWVLEDDLHIAAKSSHFAVTRGTEITAIETNAS
jgi:hypothetical protein